MIASNYRKHPQAMALQLVLDFGHALIWHVRPTTRWGRALRAARAALAKARGRIAYPVPPAYCQRLRDPRRMVQASLIGPFGATAAPAWPTRYTRPARCSR